MTDLRPYEWLGRLQKVATAEEVRQLLRSQHPAFERGMPPRLAILGAAEEGRRLVHLCRGHGIEVLAICDDDPAKHGMMVEGLAVKPGSALDALDRSVPVVIASHRTVRASKALRAKGFSNVAPTGLLQALEPAAFPAQMHYVGIVESLVADKLRILAVADMVADDESRAVLDAAVGYRLTFDPAILDPFVDVPNHYQPPGMFELGDDEVYVDAGTFDGDSIGWFIERTGGRFSRVVGFEPDPKNFALVEKNFRDEPRVQVINKGLFSKDTVLRFSDDASESSIFVADGRIQVPVTSLDKVMDGARADFIKMNIEGCEIDALWGALHTIRRWQPRLALSVYHHPNDLWRIPEMVRFLLPDHDLHLRQHQDGITETVLYACWRA